MHCMLKCNCSEPQLAYMSIVYVGTCVYDDVVCVCVYVGVFSRQLCHPDSLHEPTVLQAAHQVKVSTTWNKG